MSGLRETLTSWTTQVSDAERNSQRMLHKSRSEKRLTPRIKWSFLLFFFSFFLPFRKETYNSFYIGFYHRKDLYLYVPLQFLLGGETPYYISFSFTERPPTCSMTQYSFLDLERTHHHVLHRSLCSRGLTTEFTMSLPRKETDN